VPGLPPKLHVEVGAKTISESRVSGVLDPARDPWLIGGDRPISFLVP
jgi:hypothetical protein